jgi:hypothetical protein
MGAGCDRPATQSVWRLFEGSLPGDRSLADTQTRPSGMSWQCRVGFRKQDAHVERVILRYVGLIGSPVAPTRATALRRP